MILAWLAGFGPLPLDADARNRTGALARGGESGAFLSVERETHRRLFAESIANQLANTVNGFPEALNPSLRTGCSIVGTAQADSAAAGSTLTGVAIRLSLGALGDELSFDRAFVRPLKKLY